VLDTPQTLEVARAFVLQTTFCQARLAHLALLAHIHSPTAFLAWLALLEHTHSAMAVRACPALLENSHLED